MLTPALLIQRKRDGKELKRDQIHAFVRGIQNGDVADYQATAWLMAVFLNGMTTDETIALTEAMLDSGERYDLSAIPGMKIDKHSTGGVGDKVSLILAPLAAACGLKVPMMSGRGLGHSGGTLDKLESISGFDVGLSKTRFEEVLAKVGCAMIGQSERIAPADKKLYALRDVTATVECIPLIVASILSKKLAEGAEGLILDVKVGSGAFMKSRVQARKLAKTLIHVGKKMGLKCRAVLTDMNQPLGYSVGNALEVLESIEVLRNQDHGRAHDLGSGDLKELTIQLCAHMLEMGGVTGRLAEGRKLAHSRLSDGSAWNSFQDLVKCQGGSLEQINDPKKLPLSSRTVSWRAPKRGFITKINTETIGHLLVELGGGRKKASDSVDAGVGFIFHRKLGAKLQVGDAVATVYLPEKLSQDGVEQLEKGFFQALEISGARNAVPKLILETMG